jgi:hypothetical protein
MKDIAIKTMEFLLAYIKNYQQIFLINPEIQNLILSWSVDKD